MRRPRARRPQCARRFRLASLGSSKSPEHRGSPAGTAPGLGADVTTASNWAGAFGHVRQADVCASAAPALRQPGHVAQHLRPPVPRHDLRRESRDRARLRGRRLPARSSPGGRGDPGRTRPPQTRPVAVHHPAPRARSGEDPVRRVLGRPHRRPPAHDRHADRADDREHRPALQGLFRDPRQLPSRTCRLHLRCQVRDPRLSRRRPLLGPGNRRAGRGRSGGPQGRARNHDPGCPRADGAARHRAVAMGLGGSRQQPLLLSRRRDGGILRIVSRRRFGRTAPRWAP